MPNPQFRYLGFHFGVWSSREVGERPTSPFSPLVGLLLSGVWRDTSDVGDPASSYAIAGVPPANRNSQSVAGLTVTFEQAAVTDLADMHERYCLRNGGRWRQAVNIFYIQKSV